MPGLSPNIRLANNDQPQMPEGVSIDMGNDASTEGDQPQFDDKGNVIEIQHDDGSITISLDGRPVKSAKSADNGDWFCNLVDQIDSAELSRISEELLRGVRDDLTSRQTWVDDRAQGLKLLGLKIEIPGANGSADGAPVEGMNRVRHPLLLEAVLRFQANARSELLPTDGPFKIRDDDNNSDLAEDEVANALENDLNHYITVTASEYYPDTDRMLLMLGFGGSAFKKIYFCPLRNRPVSETVDADDLIVNNTATDIANARRVTHRTMMRPSTVKRLQILGVYRDIKLDTPLQVQMNELKLAQADQQGIDPSTFNPDDRDREIYEIDCELDVKGFEHEWKEEPTGLEIPYRVTLDVSSRQVLSIVRNYDEDTAELPEARQNYVKYTFVPGFGFYDIGLLHILGNTTNAVTAAWRLMLDNGMFSNFPGFLISKLGTRQNTNIMRVPPGGGVQIDTGGAAIGDAVMPLPYNSQQMAPLMNLVSNMVETGQRIGGTAEQPVGEGKADAPVGTTLALIEQATKVLNSVHKRMHRSQTDEFALILRTFREHPKSFWQRNRKPAYPWDETVFLKAIEDADLVPQADPNTSSQTQRLMKIIALKQLQAASPNLYDPVAIDKAALAAIGFANPASFMVSSAAQAAPPPQLIKEKAEMENEAKKANADMLDAQTKAKLADFEIQSGNKQAGQSTSISPQELAIKKQDADTKAQQIQFQQQRAAIEDQNRDKDRESDLAIEKMKIEEAKIQEAGRQAHERDLTGAGLIADHIKHVTGLAATNRPQPQPKKGQ